VRKRFTYLLARDAPAGEDRRSIVVCRYVERNALRAGLVRRAEQRRRRVPRIFRRGETIAEESFPQIQRTRGTRGVVPTVKPAAA
jgi:hypothetical protein